MMEGVPDTIRVKMEMMEEAIRNEVEEAEVELEEGIHSNQVDMPVLQPAPESQSLSIESGIEHYQRDFVNSEVEGTVWYQCKHCLILLEDVMMFLFHLRFHDDALVAGTGELGPNGLEQVLSEAGVHIFSPIILIKRVSQENVTCKKLPPMPRLTRAPASVLQTSLLPENARLQENLPRKCKLCLPHQHFNTRSQFVDHLFQKHRLDKEFRCSKAGCRYKTRSVQFIEDHIENHPEPYSRVYICHLCLPKSHWFQSTKYAKHMLSHLGKDGRYSCPHCPYSTPGLQLFNKHNKKKHPQLGSRPLASILKHTNAQQEHMRRRRMEEDSSYRRKFLCWYCSKAWFSRKMYESHMILKHRNAEGFYDCTECEFGADTIRNIARHYKFKHAGSGSEEFIQADSNTYNPIEQESVEDIQAEEYEFKHPEIEMGVEHMEQSFPAETLTHLRTGNREEEKELSEWQSSSSFKCPLCNSLSPNPNTYFDHIFQKHCRDNAVYCPSCSFRSTSIETVLQHDASTHLPEPLPKPLPQHKNTQHPVVPSTNKIIYVCRYCKSDWTEVGKYSQHMRLHLDEFGHFRCPYCHLPYPTLNRFNEHVKRRHEAPSINSVQHSRKSKATIPKTLISTVVNSRRTNSMDRRRLTGNAYLKKNYSCLYCDPNGLSFTSVKLYSRHMRELHMNSDGLYACPSCPAVLPTTLKKINEHMKRKTHPFNPSPQMNLEDSGGPILENLLRRNQLKEENGAEEDASTSTGNKLNVKKWFQCKTCFVLVETKEKLTLHYRIHHMKTFVLNGGSISSISEKPKPTRVEDETDYLAEESLTPPTVAPRLPLQMPLHKCKLCSPHSWFRTAVKLDEHMKEAHSGGNEGNSASPRLNFPKNPVIEKPKRKMTCVFCLSVWNKQREYIQHMKEEHTDEDGNFYCPKCPTYSTPLLSRATKHIRRHSKVSSPKDSRPPEVRKRRRPPWRGKGRRRQTKPKNEKRTLVNQIPF